MSGVHINPVISIAPGATKRFSTRDMTAYVTAQIIGVSLESLFFQQVGMDAVTIGGLGATAPFPGIAYGQAILVEFIGTYILMVTIMGAAVDRNPLPGFAAL